MENLYLVLMDTPGFFAGIIRRVIKLNYIHVIISMDDALSENYSMNRRHPDIPILAGFVREHPSKIVMKFPESQCRILCMQCTSGQKREILKRLRYCHIHRFRFHYCVIGLPFILMDRPFYLKNQFTCSGFLAKLFDDNGIHLFHKHFSLVTPKDFYELDDLQVIYEGKLCDYVKERCHAAATSNCFHFL